LVGINKYSVDGKLLSWLVLQKKQFLHLLKYLDLIYVQVIPWEAILMKTKFDRFAGFCPKAK